MAAEYLAMGAFKCHWALQRQLALATAAGDWNALRKWYRVHLCVRELLAEGRRVALARVVSRPLPRPANTNGPDPLA